MHRPLKALAFAVLLASFAALALGMSLYKVAVVNAFLRLAPVTDTQVAAPPSTEVENEAMRLRGQHLVQVLGCQDCHGPQLQGRVLHNEPDYLVVTAPNLTPHPQAHVAGWDAARWQQALHLGVDAEWRVLWWMPRQALMQLAQSDVAALRAYLQALAPVCNPLPQSHLAARGYADVALRRLLLLDRTPLPAANAPWPQLPPTAQDPAFGPYLASLGRCTSCHGPQQGLAKPPFAQQAPPLVQTGRAPSFAAWDTSLRAGRCPDGLTEQQRGAPSRMHAWSEAESWALFRTLASP